MTESGDAETLALPPSRPPEEAATLAPAVPSSDAVTVVPAGGEATVAEPQQPFVVDLAAGILGPYRELQLLGEGPHGSTYLGIHATLRRRVRLTVLLDAAQRDEFLRVVGTVAGLHGPHLDAAVLEAGTQGGVTFVALEERPYPPLEGFGPRSRAAARREGLFPNRELGLALLGAARGLQALHAAGLTHGPITPAHLVQGREGTCLRGLGQAGGAVAADLRELAAAFAELLTGQRPGPDLPSDVPAIVRTLRRQNPGLSRELAAVLARCLTADARQHLGTAAALAVAVEPLTRQQLRPAGWIARLGTALLDLPMVVGPAVLLTLFVRLLAPVNPGFSSLLCVVGAYTLWECTLGWTPGRRLRGLRLLDYSSSRPDWRWLLARSLGRFALVLAACALLFAVLLPVLGQAGVWPTVLGGGPLLGLLLLYGSSRLTPTRQPLHDFLTGITWYEPQPEAEPTLADEPARPESLTALPAEQEAPNLGQLQQYELRRLLGQGGMGAVYLAWDITLKRTVALKLLTTPVHSSALQVRRFEREAMLASQLQHPNVARVYGFGQSDSKPYMVMEFIPGQTLERRVEAEGPLPVAQAWDFLRQAAEALAEAGRLGIVHRDIKPSNLMLTEGNLLKVTDFGISRTLDDGDHEPVALSTAPVAGDGSLTRTGALLGTPMYMSPEQARGEKLDPRSDIYSLGLTLYYLLRGEPPFQGKDVHALIRKQTSAQPAGLPAVLERLTPEQADVLQRMLAKRREDRFASWDEALQAIREAAPQPPVLARPARRVLAFLLDSALVFGSVYLVRLGVSHWLAGPDVSELPLLEDGLAVLVYSVMYILGVGLWGQTPGKWLLGVRVVRRTGQPVGLGRALLRLLTLQPDIMPALTLLPERLGLPQLPVVEWVSGVLAFLQFGSLVVSLGLISFTRRRRGLHDLAADTVVLQVPRRHRRKHRPMA